MSREGDDSPSLAPAAQAIYKWKNDFQSHFSAFHPKGVFIYKIHVDFATCIRYNTSIKSV